MLELRIVKTVGQKQLVNDIITKYHSYVPRSKSVGRRIDYLIYVIGEENVYPPDEECIGMIGIGSSTYPPCKDILTHLSISRSKYKEIFNCFGNNWRFCLTKKIPNIGSQILSVFCKLARRDWKLKYGDDLRYLITFVAGGNDGIVYKAAGWECIGYTAGLPKHEAVSMKWDRKDLDSKFVKPTGEDRKKIFIKQLK